MADFCKNCSLEMFNEDFRDLAGIVTEEEFKAGAIAQVLCEGCGVICVDHNGQKIEPINGNHPHG